MKKNKTLTISLFNRPKYTKILLDSLQKCYGIEDYKIFISCDPGSNEVIDLATSFNPNQTDVIVNKYRLGCAKNIYQCLEIGFYKNDYHIHFEDDTIPGKDCLKYLEWAGDKYQNDAEIFNITSYVNANNKTDHYLEKNFNIDKVLRRRFFSPWGWATWIDRFQEIKQKWSNYAWDNVINDITRKSRYEIYPTIARVQNIGSEMGTHVPSEQWHKDNQYNEWWIESINEYNLNDFTEI